MIELLEGFPPLVLTILAGCFTWGITALGASMVFFFKKINRKVLDALMGFSAGVMIAASFWSLLSPSLSLSVELGYIEWLFPALGFFIGGGFVLVASVLLDNALKARKIDQQNSKSVKRSLLLVSSITLHNIPEGLSVGVAFGAISLGIPNCTLIGAILLAVGIGLQNFPEGASVSLPLRRDGMSRGKAFFIGQASGFPEPCAAIIGYLLATTIRAILPFSLAFSAGAMIAVCASELIPESGLEHKNLSTMGCIIGFLVMMIMDVALG